MAFDNPTAAETLTVKKIAFDRATLDRYAARIMTPGGPRAIRVVQGAGANRKSVVFVARHADVVEVLTDEDRFDVRHYDRAFAAIAPKGKVLLMRQEGDVRALRYAILRAAWARTPWAAPDASAVHDLARAKVDAVLAESGSGTIDLIGDYGYRAPSLIAEDMLGLPGPARWGLFARLSIWLQNAPWGRRFTAASGPRLTLFAWSQLIFGQLFQDFDNQWPAPMIWLGRRCVRAFRAHIGACLDDIESGAWAPPADSLLAALMEVRGQFELGDADYREHVVSLMFELVGTAQIVPGLAFASVIEGWLPDGFERPLAKLEEGALDAFVEESLRLSPPERYLLRNASCETEIGGVRIAPGESVCALVAAAGRDPAVVEHPDEVRLDRPEGVYLHFGPLNGPHRCFGWHVARPMVGEMLAGMKRAGLTLADGAKPPDVSSAMLCRLPVGFGGAAQAGGSAAAAATAQRAGFVVCLPIADPNAVASLEARLAALGNPAGAEMRGALDAAGCIHFMSMAVIRDPLSPAAFLVLDISADGAPVSVVRRLAACAHGHLGPLIDACAGKPRDLAAALEEGILSTEPAPFPGRGKTIGLAFQGTPGLTIQQIEHDQRVADLARAAVKAIGPRGSGPLAYLQAARAAVPPGLLADAPPPEPPAKPTTSLFRLLLAIARQSLLAWLAAVPALAAALMFALRILVAGPRVLAPARMAAFERAYDLTAISLLSLSAFVVLVSGVAAGLLRLHEMADTPEDLTPDPRLVAELMARENRGLQNHMIAVTPISAGALRLRVFLVFAFATVRNALKAKVWPPGFLNDLGTIHFAQWVRLPKTRALAFFSNYGGSWESYLEDFITQSSPGATGIWSNAKGFPRTQFLFFGGAQDGDRFKRYARRHMIPTPFWYSAYPHLTTAQIRANAQIRQGLVWAKDESDADQWLRLFGSAPRPVSSLETDEIQGLALKGYRRHFTGDVAVLTLAPAAPVAALRAWLKGLTADIAFGERPVENAAFIGLSASGLAKLGLDDAALASGFCPAFELGMDHPSRAHVLGDTGANRSEAWAWGNARKPADAVLILYAETNAALAGFRKRILSGFQGLGSIHPITLHDLPAAGLPIREPFGFIDGISQPAIQGLLSSRKALPNDLVAPGEFLLGYKDGRDYFPPTPLVDAAYDPGQILADPPAGYPLSSALSGTTRDLGQNGSFLVVRQIRQDKAAFDAFLKSAAAKLPPGLGDPDPVEWLAAKMVGRWRVNGAPLALHPDRPPPHYDALKHDQPFLFGHDDPQGHGCPFSGHVRRANPRDQFGAGDPEQIAIVNRHRILRRSRVYVEGEDRGKPGEGLVFMALTNDIERQFEFLQQTWIGSPAFNGLRDEPDSLASQGRKGVFTIPTAEGPEIVTDIPPFVQVVGGAYVFLPSRRALEYLSA